MPATRRDGLAVGALGLLAMLHWWPIALRPATASFGANHDAQLHVWLIAWVARNVLTPWRIHDANIYHPVPDSLTYVDSTILPGVMAAPVYAATGSALLAHNFAWLAGLLLTAVGTYLLARHLTGDRLAACLAGVAFTFGPFIPTHHPQVMQVHLQWLPLALLALDRMLAGARGAAVLLGVCVAAAGLTSGYQLMYVLVALAAWLLVAGGLSGTLGRKRLWTALGVAVVVSLALAVPLLLPWLGSVADRGVNENRAALASYLRGTSWLHGWWSAPLWNAPTWVRGAFFPGVVPLGLVAWLLAARRRRIWKTPPVIACATVGALGVLLSLGSATPLYGVVRAIFPPAAGVRVLSRFGVLFLLAVALLAAFGLAELRHRLRSPRRARGAALLLVAALNVELFTFVATEPLRVPRIYDRVARLPEDTVLLELPYYAVPGSLHLNAPYVLASTRHWHALVNGYASFVPAEQSVIARELMRFDRPQVPRLLRRIGVTHLLVHPDAYPPVDRGILLDHLDASPAYRLILADRQGRRLYRFGRGAGGRGGDDAARSRSDPAVEDG